MLKTKSKTKNSFRKSSYHFDDCPICQAMAKAEKSGRNLSLEELRQVFAKANAYKARI